jgi:signal transduction histidine kinase
MYPLRLISIPSVVFCTLFLWNGLFYLFLSRLMPVELRERRKTLFFGLTALAMALYSFSTIFLYSAPTLHFVIFWQRLQFASAVLLFIFFILFSAQHLALKNIYWQGILPILSLLFIITIFLPGLVIGIQPAPKIFTYFGHSTKIMEFAFTPLATLFVAWALASTFYLGWEWFRYYQRHIKQFAIPISFTLFLIAGINDFLVAQQVYRFFYVFEIGFLGYIVSMGFQLFNDYAAATRHLTQKTHEVEALNEELRFFVSSMSHDLSNPLVSIRGFLDILEGMEVGDPKQQEYLGRVKSNAEQMQQMLSDLLQLARIGRVEETVERVDFKKVMTEIRMILGGEKLLEGATLEQPNHWPSIYSSEKGIKQILMNLIHNALKFSPKGKAHVIVDCQAQGGGVLINVSDQGPGIPAEMKERIFSPFFRLQHQIPGTGMGLAIVKKTAENLGGRVWLDISYREGARFCVYLPCKR